MSRAGKFVVVASAAWLAIGEVIIAHRTDGRMLLGMFVLPCILPLAICAVVFLCIEWQQRRWKAAVPLAACVFAMVVYMPLGRLVRRAVFAWALPSYEAIVRQVESGSIPVSAEFTELPQAVREARLAYDVSAQRDSDGVVRVVFLTESGFPALHSGYLYSSSGQPGVDPMWTIVQKVRDNWFFISN